MTNQADTATRMAVLNCVAFGVVSPAVTRALNAAGVVLPAVVLESPPGAYPVAVHDDGTLTSAQVDALAAPYVAAEQAVATQQANLVTLQQAGLNALAANVNYLNIGTPTTAQAVAQVAALTRQVDGIIRLLLNQLDTTAGT